MVAVAWAELLFSFLAPAMVRECQSLVGFEALQVGEELLVDEGEKVVAGRRGGCVRSVVFALGRRLSRRQSPMFLNPVPP